MKVSREKEGGQTNIVCIYIYGFLWRRGGQGKNSFFFFRAYPLPNPSYVHSLSLTAGCQRLPKNVQRARKILWEKEGGKTNIVCVYLRGEVAKERELFFL